MKCNEQRARIGKFDENCAIYRDNPFGRQACEDTQANFQRLSICRRQTNVACFDVKRILTGNQELDCSKTIAKCKEQRAFVSKNMKDDLKVLSDCRPE